MEKRHEHILNEFGQELKSTLNLSYLTPGLVKRKLLTDGEVANLRHPNKSTLEKNDEFLNILKTKGSKAFTKFLEALQEEDQHLGHEDLYEKLLSADKKMNNTMSSNSSQSSVEIIPDTLQDPANSPTHSRPRSRPTSASSIGTQLSVASETRLMAAMESLKNHVDQSIKSLESRISNQIDILKREVQYLKSRPGSSRGSSSTLESSSGYSASAYEGDSSSGGSDTNLLQHRHHQVTIPHWQMGLHTNHRRRLFKANQLSSISGSSLEIEKINVVKYPQPMPNNSLVSSDSNDYLTCSEIPPDIDLSGRWEVKATVETQCTCKPSQVPPVFHDNMMHFVAWDDTGLTRMRNATGTIRENFRSYDIAKSCWFGCTKPIGKFSSRQCIYCVFWYSEKITLLADKGKDTKPPGGLETIHNLALYSLNHDAEMPSWKEIPKSDISLSNKSIDPNNCISTQHEDKVIVITYSSQSSSINFHIFDSNTPWKSISQPLSQSKLPSNIDVQLQSCVILNGKIYYSLKYGDQIRIYQSKVAQMDQSSNTLTLDCDITQCFLAVFSKHIFMFCLHCHGKTKTYIEVEALDFKRSGKFTHTFSSAITLVAVAVKSKTEMIMVYHDSSDNQCYIKTWKTAD